MKRRILPLIVLLLGPVNALNVIPGTQTVYSVSRDPITDANTSVIALPEINDNYRDTVFFVRCSDRTQPTLWSSLNSKNDLISRDEAATGIHPVITLRLGNDVGLTRFCVAEVKQR